MNVFKKCLQCHLRDYGNKNPVVYMCNLKFRKIKNA